MAPAAGQRSERGRAGFTLVELVMVIAIIGILAGFAIPRFREFLARSKRSEARIALSAIYDAEIEYFANNGQYTSIYSQLGFDQRGSVLLDPSTLQSHYYTYSLAALNGGTNFQVIANGDIDPGNPVRDILVVGK